MANLKSRVKSPLPVIKRKRGRPRKILSNVISTDSVITSKLVETKRKELNKVVTSAAPNSNTKPVESKKKDLIKMLSSADPRSMKKMVESKKKKLKNPLPLPIPESPSKTNKTKKKELNKLLTSDAKVALMLQNGPKLRDKFTKSIPLNYGIINKSALSVVKDQIISKSGLIKKKSRDHLKLMDKLLMSELLITETIPSKTSGAPPIIAQPAPYQAVDNNNYDGISDQNKSGSDQSAENSPKKHKFKKPKRTSDLKIQNIKLSSTKTKHNKIKLKKDWHKSKASKVTSNTKQVTLNNEVRPTLSLFQCDYCNKTFRIKSSLRRHIYLHLGIKPYICAYCSKRFRQQCNLTVHLQRRHCNKNEELYICNECNKPFKSKENLRLHIASHECRCVYCNVKFPNYLQLTQHEKQHLVSGRFHCSICNMSYDSRARLSLHVKSHLNIKEYVCHHCGKDFLRLNSIRRHVDICHGGQRIQCPVCKKKLKGHLTEHLRTHDKKRPHACPECGQRFTQSTQLTVHRRSHTGTRPYACRICERPFTHSNALMLHIRRHTGEKPFTCAMCPISFSQLPHMKSHMKKIHGKSASYKCDKCESFFKLKTELENHVKGCTHGDRELTFEESIQASVAAPEEIESVMSLSRMRFLLALLLTMIASKDKLKCLGFNKRLIDDLLMDSLEAMGQVPCKDQTLTPIKRLKVNIQTLLEGTVPEDQMTKFREENKSTEELLVLLTDEKKQ